MTDADPAAPTVSDPARTVEVLVRRELAMVRDQLADRRASRDLLNAEIRDLVAAERVIAQAAAVFTRAIKEPTS